MSNNAAPAVDAEMQQFQYDLLQSVREFKAGNFEKTAQFVPDLIYEQLTCPDFTELN